MDRSQSFEIQNTQNTHFQVPTTALTQAELSTVELPSYITISPTLTPKSRVLVSYKAVFTDKYIQALQWNIPIVNSQFLYSLNSHHKAFEMKPFQGAVFTTSQVTEEIYSNYFVLLGAKYEPNCSIFVDFLICDNEDSEKYDFCRKYEIPIIKTSQVFSGDYSAFYRWNAKFYSPESKLENYKNLIIAGGGMTDINKPCTHIFVDKNYNGDVLEEQFTSADSIFSYLFK